MNMKQLKKKYDNLLMELNQVSKDINLYMNTNRKDNIELINRKHQLINELKRLNTLIGGLQYV